MDVPANHQWREVWLPQSWRQAEVLDVREAEAAEETAEAHGGVGGDLRHVC